MKTEQPDAGRLNPALDWTRDASVLRLKIMDLMTEAKRVHAETTSWVEFYRRVFGLEGLLNSSQRTTAISDEQRFELIEMLTDLRSRDQSKQARTEPNKMITTRIPTTMHAVIAEECKRLELSMNMLVISKLIQPLDPRFTPECSGRVRGRRIHWKRELDARSESDSVPLIDRDGHRVA